jgi:adenine-specific DNA-methyltransferase
MSQKKNVIEEQSINDVNYELLKKQFPHAVSIDENGKYVIDPQKLQMSLDPSLAEIKEDGYGLNWVGKKEAYHNAFTKNYKVLKPLKEISKNWDETENILIKGDNLDALKILRQNYFESIKMIYIDPPYNTKNDGFVYNDDFTTSTEQTLEELGYDKEYIDYIENIQGAKTHSGWLSFMYPRLLIAKDLLKEDGVIYISIDDNEMVRLRLLCDEVFGEENFISEICVVNNIAGRSDSKDIAIAHEYVLMYQKSDTYLSSGIPLNEEQQKEYRFSDENGQYRKQGLRKRGSNSKREDRPNMYYPIYYGIHDNKISLEEFDGSVEILPKLSDGSDGCWRWGKDTFLKEKNNLEVSLVTTRNEYDIFEKVYLYVDGKIRRRKLKSFLLDSKYTSDTATTTLGKILPNKIFTSPKPIELIQDFIINSTNHGDIILDFFAGSGTSGHAVMDLNKNDDEKRKFILVQWTEETPEKSQARKKGYKTVFDITKVRLIKTGDQIAKGDIGFRTFEIVEDQKQKIYQKSLEEVNQDDLLSLMEKPDISSNEEILYNLFVAETLPLTTKHIELIKDKLYLASNVAFILGDITSDELVEALKDNKECEYITVYSPNISNDKFTLEIESNISKLGIKPDKLRFRG